MEYHIWKGFHKSLCEICTKKSNLAEALNIQTHTQCSVPPIYTAPGEQGPGEKQSLNSPKPHHFPTHLLILHVKIRHFEPVSKGVLRGFF